MPDQGIFNSPSDQDSSKQTNPSSISQTQGDTQGHLAILVGETRKYKTADELAKAYIHADEFAERLKAENAALRAEAAKAKTVQDVLDRLNAEEGRNTQDQGGKKTDTQSSLSASEVATIVRDTLTGLETQRSKESNLKKADADMRKLFGDKAAEVFQKEAATPEMRKALMDLAAVSPEKFVALFQKPQAGGTQTDSRSTVNTSALTDTGLQGRVLDPGCKEFYDALRRKEPGKYYSSAVQLQMTRAAEADPAKFFKRS